MSDVMERGKQWANDCGVEYRASGSDANFGHWSYMEHEGPCEQCGEMIPAGRLVVGLASHGQHTHVACAAPIRTSGLGYGECGKLDRSLRGTKHESTPKAAAKYLSKLDPKSCPRFTITPTTAVTSTPEMRELVAAGKGFAARREVFVAEGQPQAAPAAKVAPKVRKPAAPKVADVPAPVVDARELECCQPCARAGRWTNKYVGAECPSCADMGAAKPAAPAPSSVDVPGELPSCVAAWLERLVYGPKKDYARAWAEHTFCGGPMPADPGAPWAEKARRRMEYVLAG